MGNLEERKLVEVTPPPVCVLCWEYVYEGEQTVRFEEGVAHRKCWVCAEDAA